MPLPFCPQQLGRTLAAAAAAGGRLAQQSRQGGEGVAQADMRPPHSSNRVGKRTTACDSSVSSCERRSTSSRCDWTGSSSELGRARTDGGSSAAVSAPRPCCASPLPLLPSFAVPCSAMAAMACATSCCTCQHPAVVVSDSDLADNSLTSDAISHSSLIYSLRVDYGTPQ